MNIKIIKTEVDYEKILTRIEALMDIPVGDARTDELELLVLLVEKYEEQTLDLGLPDPIEAIKFRMEQAGLTKKDLVPYIGSQSKVSEILNRKRPLSLSMMRSLNEGLGIAADVLLQKPNEVFAEKQYKRSDYPFTEMFKRGYFGITYGTLALAKEHIEECFQRFFINYNQLATGIRYRRSNSKIGKESILIAWQAQILNQIANEKIGKYVQSNLNRKFIESITKFSQYTEGIRLLKEALNKIGIHFVILKHLPKTRLDGACFMTPSGNPVVALTLRFDRLDNFWFTLMHELGHIFLKHINLKNQKVYMDDTVSESDQEPDELAADKFANEAFLPEKVWKASRSSLVNSNQILELADDLEISPTVIAGRLRFEDGDFTKFTSLIGQGEVRKVLLGG